MVDNFQKSGGIAYSFGISNDVSWDLDMAARGYDIFMYDPTIKGLPAENARFHFFKEGIAGEEVKAQSLNTLENFVRRNGHEGKDDMILKMDVEGAEWGFLSTVSPALLNKFDQMVFEFHSLIQPKGLYEMGGMISFLKKINLTHSLVHLHGNNHGIFLKFGDFVCPDILELTYVKNSNYKLADDENISLPIPEDAPNNPRAVDIPLGFWNRVSVN